MQSALQEDHHYFDLCDDKWHGVQQSGQDVCGVCGLKRAGVYIFLKFSPDWERVMGKPNSGETVSVPRVGLDQSVTQLLKITEELRHQATTLWPLQTPFFPLEKSASTWPNKSRQIICTLKEWWLCCNTHKLVERNMGLFSYIRVCERHQMNT